MAKNPSLIKVGESGSCLAKNSLEISTIKNPQPINIKSQKIVPL